MSSSLFSSYFLEITSCRVACAVVSLWPCLSSAVRKCFSSTNRPQVGEARQTNPRHVYIPTSTPLVAPKGLDHETKRNIWALIDRVKRDRCIILTTHSMVRCAHMRLPCSPLLFSPVITDSQPKPFSLQDEADALCGRIGIMSHGLMRCIGSGLHLKNRFTL